MAATDVSAPAETAAATPPQDVVPPPLRSDLVTAPQSYLGRRFIIFKNPISLAYFRLPAAHAEAAALFDGRRNLGSMAATLAGSSRYWRALSREAAVNELGALAMQLSHAGLLQVKAGSATERARRLRAFKKSRGFEMAIGHVLFFKKSLFDPDSLLGWLLGHLGWIYRPAVLGAAAVFVALSLATAVWNLDRLVAQGANFFTLSNLGLTWLLFIGVKIVHEFGHGLTAKRFGAEVHEMGFMFILFTPYLFCNVSDAWRAGKTERIAVGAAGIAVEAVIASAALWLWLFTSPGLFHQMCFNTVVLCSVSTLLFNGNPLMKFDGYYILSDVLEIPNLRAKSNAWITAWAQRNLLGLPPRTAAAAPHEASPLFGLYAVAAYFYGWFIMFSISIHIFNLLQPYGLEFISRSYVALFLFVSLALPLYRLVCSVKDTDELRTALARRGRWSLAILALLAAGLLLVPWTESINRSAVLEHARIERVSAALPGILDEVHVKSGEEVRAGQVLGRLRNPDVEAQLSTLRLQRESIEVRLRSLSSEPTEEARLGIPVLARQAREVDEELGGLERKAATLELRATRPGIVRTPHPRELAGRLFRQNQPVLEIGEPGEPRVLIALDEKQARKVRPGQPVRVIFTGLPGEVFTGEVVVAPSAPAAGFSAPSLANVLGGDIPAEPGKDNQALVPSISYFEAEARVQIPPEMLARLRPQASGRARIDVRRTNLAAWLRDRLYDAVNPQVRL